MPKPLTNKQDATPSAPSILGSAKQSVDALLGHPVMARSLLGMTADGEKAYAYPQAGEDIIVGFLDDVARYLAVVRRKGPKTGFSPAEMASILALNGPQSAWKSERTDTKTAPASKAKSVKKSSSPEEPTTYFSLNADGRELVGWQPGGKPFVFFLLPSHPNQPHLLLNEWLVERAIG